MWNSFWKKQHALKIAGSFGEKITNSIIGGETIFEQQMYSSESNEFDALQMPKAYFGILVNFECHERHSYEYTDSWLFNRNDSGHRIGYLMTL
jgi:Ni,Fe-hydrogenase I small subunit